MHCCGDKSVHQSVTKTWNENGFHRWHLGIGQEFKINGCSPSCGSHTKKKSIFLFYQKNHVFGHIPIWLCVFVVCVCFFFWLFFLFLLLFFLFLILILFVIFVLVFLLLLLVLLLPLHHHVLFVLVLLFFLFLFVLLLDIN